MSIHKAKGLEFKVVFMAALIQEKFPGRKRADYALPFPETLMHDIVDEDTYFHEEEAPVLCRDDKGQRSFSYGRKAV